MQQFSFRKRDLSIPPLPPAWLRNIHLAEQPPHLDDEDAQLIEHIRESGQIASGAMDSRDIPRAWIVAHAPTPDKNAAERVLAALEQQAAIARQLRKLRKLSHEEFSEVSKRYEQRRRERREMERARWEHERDYRKLAADRLAEQTERDREWEEATRLAEKRAAAERERIELAQRHAEREAERKLIAQRQAVDEGIALLREAERQREAERKVQQRGEREAAWRARNAADRAAAGLTAEERELRRIAAAAALEASESDMRAQADREHFARHEAMREENRTQEARTKQMKRERLKFNIMARLRAGGQQAVRVEHLMQWCECTDEHEMWAAIGELGLNWRAPRPGE